MSLFQKKRFLPYFLTQFLGAFTDNVFKNALIIVVTFHLGASSQSSGILVNLAAIIFILPFFLFSPLAGQLAEKYEKSVLIQRIKVVEILIMTCGAIGLYFQSIPWLLCVLFLMGTQSTFFGPIKYSILPQSLKSEELLHGNALVESGTFIAILFGTILGALLAKDADFFMPVTVAILLFSVLGRLASQWIPRADAVQANLKIDWNLIRSGKAIFQGLLEDRAIFLTAVGIAWFWFFGATFLTQLPNFAKTILGGTPYVATLLMAMFSIGIALGSFLCSRMSGKHVELGVVPIGALGMTLSGLVIGLVDVQPIDGLRSITQMFTHLDTFIVLVGLLFLSIFAGIFVVPMYAFMQTNSNSEKLSRNIAALNILNSAAMVIAGAFAIGVFSLGNSIQVLFVITALMNAAVALFIFIRVPDYIVRFVAWNLVHSLYRIEKSNLHHVPERGAAVITCNHVSYVDSIIVAAVCNRRVRLVMYHKIYNLPVVHYLFKMMGAIPIASGKEDAELLAAAYSEIDKALVNGELVCIFPEGGLTPDGEIQTFKPGIEKILSKNQVPVIPMALQGLWGTWFSRSGGQAMKGMPKNWMKKIQVTTGEPIPAETCNVLTIEDAVRALRADRA